MPLAQVRCIAGADSAAAAMALPAAALDCSEGRFGKKDRFIRTHADIGDLPGDLPQDLVWQGEPSLFDTMAIRFTFADGTSRVIDIDRQMASRNWFTRGRFSVPVPESASPLVAIDTVVERPRTNGILMNVRLVSQADAGEEHYDRSILYALVCGLLLIPIVYDILFFRLLRTRFMIWHILMTAGYLAFLFSNSGLIFHVFPETPLALRFQLNTLTLAISVFFAMLFVLDLLEEGLISLRMRRIALFFAGTMLALKAVTLFDLELLRMTAHSLFMLSFLPVALSSLTVICLALLKGSRAAAYLLFATSGIMLSGTLKVLADTGLISPMFPIDDVLFGSMVLLVLGTAAAVVDRFNTLRMERDRARIDAIKLGRMAMSDPLTGLRNRRAFDAVRKVEHGHAMLVADIDHFKIINDTNGHSAGDAVLRNMASLMREAFKHTEGATLYRLGGEEFAVVLPCSSEGEMRQAAERLRRAIEGHVANDDLGIPDATISVGGAMGLGRPLGQVFAEADEALYSAKNAGRNRSAVHGEDGPDVLDPKIWAGALA